MTWDGPYLPVDLTLTTASDPLTCTRSRLECSAWTLTALFAQVVTGVEPPQLFTSRPAPAPHLEVAAGSANPRPQPSPPLVVIVALSLEPRAPDGVRPLLPLP